MEITVDRRRLGWLWLVYAALWGPLRLLYLAANRAYGTDSPAGDLSSIWWILVLSWFLADLLLVLGFTFLYRTLRVGATNRNRRFWFAVSEIVPLWLLLHLSLLLFEYPISTRLESVGLGKLEVIVFAVTMVAGAAYLLRSIKSGEESHWPVREWPIVNRDNLLYLHFGTCCPVGDPVFRNPSVTVQ